VQVRIDVSVCVADGKRIVVAPAERPVLHDPGVKELSPLRYLGIAERTDDGVTNRVICYSNVVTFEAS
jgi:hypothetical protein